MKKLLILLVIPFVFAFGSDSYYCEGWSDGYKDGWCYEDYTCISPVPPICPIRRINENDTYKAGYNRGFATGIIDRSR